MEKKMDNEMEIGVIKMLYRDPSIEIIPPLGPKVCNSTYIGLFGSLGPSMNLLSFRLMAWRHDAAIPEVHGADLPCLLSLRGRLHPRKTQL